MDKMQNDYLQGHNNYPLTLTSAFNLLINWKNDLNHNSSRNDSVAFVMSSAQMVIDLKNARLFVIDVVAPVIMHLLAQEMPIQDQTRRGR